MANEKKSNLFHRERLRTKFNLDTSCIYSYELLELLLFFVFKRSDTKALSKTLFNKFHNLKSIVYADEFAFKKIKGAGEQTILFFKCIKELISRINLEELNEEVIISSTKAVLNYYSSILSVLSKEQVRVMFLNNKNRLICEEMLNEGTTTQTNIYPREIVQKALEYGAVGIIMVHNHPGGDAKPSRQDIVMTKFIKDLLIKLDIVLLDHIIVGRNKNISLKELGIL